MFCFVRFDQPALCRKRVLVLWTSCLQAIIHHQREQLAPNNAVMSHANIYSIPVTCLLKNWWPLQCISVLHPGCPWLQLSQRADQLITSHMLSHLFIQCNLFCASCFSVLGHLHNGGELYRWLSELTLIPCNNCLFSYIFRLSLSFLVKQSPANFCVLFTFIGLKNQPPQWQHIFFPSNARVSKLWPAKPLHPATKAFCQ